MSDDNTNEEESIRQANEGLARRLCCAVVSYKLGITYQHCYNSQIKHIELADYWFELADKVQRET